VVPGDVVDIRGGTYQEYVYLRVNGTASKPIVFAGHPGETVVLDGSAVAPNQYAAPGSQHDAVLNVDGQYTTVKNMEVTRSAGTGVEIGNSFVTLDTMNIHHNFMMGIDAYQQNNGLIVNSTIHDNWDFRPANPVFPGSTPSSGDSADGIHLIASNGFIIRNNHVYHNSDDGIDTWNSQNMLIEGNTVYDNGYDTGGDGDGVKLGDGGTGSTVRNNTAYGNRLSGFASGSMGGNTFEGNTSYNAGWVDFNDSLENGQPSPNVFKNNTGTKIYGMNNATQSGNRWQA
jgi:parallel beta-helix repeat protein